jgi:hypothetical protein
MCVCVFVWLLRLVHRLPVACPPACVSVNVCVCVCLVVASSSQASSRLSSGLCKCECVCVFIFFSYVCVCVHTYSFSAFFSVALSVRLVYCLRVIAATYIAATCIHTGIVACCYIHTYIQGLLLRVIYPSPCAYVCICMCILRCYVMHTISRRIS